MEGSEFEDRYSEEGFWKKIRKYALKVGEEGIRSALLLYCGLQQPASEVPAWAKAVILGALAYFIMPADAIPDVIPGVGYTDDIGVLAAAVMSVGLNIPDQCKVFADEKLKEWFGICSGGGSKEY